MYISDRPNILWSEETNVMICGIGRRSWNRFKCAFGVCTTGGTRIGAASASIRSVVAVSVDLDSHDSAGMISSGRSDRARAESLRLAPMGPVQYRRLPDAAKFHYPAPYDPPNSLSNSFRCRSTRSTNKRDTLGRPPYFFALSNATRFKSSQISAGRLIPVVRWVRSAATGSGLGLDGINRVDFTGFANCQSNSPGTNTLRHICDK